MKRFLRRVLTGLWAGLALAAPAFAQSGGLVWRIGTFDGSSGEFSGRRAEAKSPVTYVVGSSDPARDWTAFQAVARPGSSPHRVEFQLPAAPAATEDFRLHVVVMFEQPSIPALRIWINGQRGLFYPHPLISNQGSDASQVSSPGFSRWDLTVDFPGSDLHAGANTISFEAVATAAESVPGAGLTYDALELTRGGSFAPGIATVEIVPTDFYMERDGGLAELVEACVRYGSRPEDGSLDLEIAGRHFRQALAGDQDFGEERFEFAVPEFPAGTPARAVVMIDGQRLDSEAALEPKKKWTVYIVAHTHLDIGYTDFQAKVGAVQARELDQAMDAAAQYPGFSYTTDGSWDAEQFMAMRSPEDRARLIEAIKRRQIYIPANYSTMLLGFPTAETLIRSLYYTADLSRKYGTPFNFAVATDSPSYPWSYASVLASAGIKYFLAGPNNNRGPILLKGNLRQQSPMWWVGPDGQRVLFWYTLHYEQVNRLFGMPPVIAAGQETLPVFLQTYESPLYHGDAVIVYGTQADNQEFLPDNATLVGRWNRIYAYPKLQYAGIPEAMAAVAARQGNAIHVVSGDGGPYWEDGIATHAYYAAIERSSESRGPSAEKIQTISALANPRLVADRSGLNAMWRDMLLYDEHNALVANAAAEHDTLKAIGMLAVKNSYAARAGQEATELLQSGMANLADSIATGPGSLIVFNTLNWTRGGLVTIDLDDGDEVVDGVTGEVVPVEVLSEDRFHRVQFMATDVPAVGYRVYHLRHALARSALVAAIGPTDAGADQAVLETPYYRVELDPEAGAVRSIFDKTLNRELVDRSSPYRFGQYLYVTGGDMPIGKFNGLLMYGNPPPVLTIHQGGGGRLVSVQRTPYGWSARLESSAVNTPKIATEIRLFDGERKIEFLETLKKREVFQREGVYFAFPFAMRSPQFQYENQNGVVDPSRDMLPGAGLDWFTLQHWVSVQQNGVSATVLPLDAALVSLGDIIRGTWSSEFKNRPGAIFSNVVNNYHVPRTMTDLPADPVDDDLRFRYVVTSAPATSPADLSRLGWEEMTPLEVDVMQTQDRMWARPEPLDGEQGSFLKVDDPALLLSTWKVAEDGKGTILRFLDLGGNPRTVSVEVPLLNLTGARLTDAVERNLRGLSLDGPHRFRFEIRPFQIVTIRLVGQPAALPLGSSAR